MEAQQYIKLLTPIGFKNLVGIFEYDLDELGNGGLKV